MACLGAYRALYIINWIYKAYAHPGYVLGAASTGPPGLPLCMALASLVVGWVWELRFLAYSV